MSKDPKKLNITQVGNPEKGGVEVVQAMKSPTRGTAQVNWGYAVEDGILCFYKQDTSRGGWIKMGDALGGNYTWKWDIANDGIKGIAGTWTKNTNAAAWTGQVLLNDPPALNDEVALGSLYIKISGTYRLSVFFTSDSSGGKGHFFFNDTDKGQVDMYSGSPTHNNSDTIDFTLDAGHYDIHMKMASKHASSSTYYGKIQSRFLIRI